MKPVVDAFHFSVGHIDLVVVVMSKVKHFRAFAAASKLFAALRLCVRQKKESRKDAKTQREVE